MELFDYIEVFYNQRRRHSTLGQISPAAFHWGSEDQTRHSAYEVAAEKTIRFQDRTSTSSRASSHR